MAIIDNNMWYNGTANEKYNANQNMWTISDSQHAHLHHNTGITSSPAMGAGKYEQLPNFVGGLYVEDGILMLMKKDETKVKLGKMNDLSTNRELLLSILDEFFE